MKLKVLCLIFLPLSTYTMGGCGFIINRTVETVAKNMSQANTAAANTGYEA
jgi:uncharacterized protein YceK